MITLIPFLTSGITKGNTFKGFRIQFCTLRLKAKGQNKYNQKPFKEDKTTEKERRAAQLKI